MSKTFTLKTPVKCGEKELAELRLRKPLAGDLRHIPGGDAPFAAIIELAAVLADVPVTVIERLEIEDFKPVSGYVSGFLS
jgi:hypothetical protein